MRVKIYLRIHWLSIVVNTRRMTKENIEVLPISNCEKADMHYLKSVRIPIFSGPHFPAFALNKERYCLSLRIWSGCRKIRSRKTPNTDTFHAVTRLTFHVRIKNKATLLSLNIKATLLSLNIEFSRWKVRGLQSWCYNARPKWFSGNQLSTSMANSKNETFFIF